MLKRVQQCKVTKPSMTNGVTAARDTSSTASPSASSTSNRPLTPSQIEWTKQLHAYVAWVNSQLRKKPGCRLVTDLRNDFRDGTALVNLIEIVGGIKLDGIELKPSSAQNKRKNVEKALNFMANLNMDIQSTSVKDIIEGNIKSTMRVILAIAKQYKPNCITPTAKTNANPQWIPTYGSLDSRRTVNNSIKADKSDFNNPKVVSNSSNVTGSRPFQSNGYHNDRSYHQQPNSRNFLTGFHQSRTVDPKSLLGSKSLSWSSYRAYRNSMSNWSDGDYGDYAGSDSEGSGRHSPELRIQTYNLKQSTISLNERLINGGGEVDGARSISSPTNSLTKVTLSPMSNRSPLTLKTNSLSPAKSLPCLPKMTDVEGYRDYENYPPVQTSEALTSSKPETCVLKKPTETNVRVSQR